jgi:hypothetical protein
MVLLRKLHGWNAASWRHGERAALVRAACVDLAVTAARAERRDLPTLPDLGPHVLADQLAVLAADAVRSGVPEQQVADRLRRLATDLGL